MKGSNLEGLWADSEYEKQSPGRLSLTGVDISRTLFASIWNYSRIRPWELVQSERIGRTIALVIKCFERVELGWDIMF